MIKRWLAISLLLLLLVLPSVSLAWNPPGGWNAWTQALATYGISVSGSTITLSKDLKLTSYTVATLPVAVTGKVVVVTDGNAADDCTTGGGSTAVLCRYSGAAWVGLGGGGAFSVTDITGQADDSTPATTATAVLAQSGALIESTLGQIATAIGVVDWTSDQGATNIHSGNIPDLSGTYLTTATGQPLDATLTALAGLTIADVSIIEGTGADAVNVVTSGGPNYFLASNSGNTALEFKTPAEVLSVIGAQASNTNLDALAGLTGADVSIIQWTGAGAMSVLTGSAANQILGVNAANNALEFKDTINVTTVNLPSSDADPGTTAGQIRHDSSDTNASGFGLIEYYDGTNVRTVIDSGTAYTIVVRTEFLPVAYMEDGAAPPAASAVLASTRKVRARAFDGASNENLEMHWLVPDDYVGGVKFRFIGYVSSATAPANTEVVAFSLAGCSLANSEVLGCTAGTAQESTLTADATYVQYDRITGAWSSAITLTGIAAGESAQMIVTRVAATTDTYVQDFDLAGIEIKYQSKIMLNSTY